MLSGLIVTGLGLIAFALATRFGWIHKTSEEQTHHNTND
jgi:hypothetical protein